MIFLTTIFLVANQFNNCKNKNQGKTLFCLHALLLIFKYQQHYGTTKTSNETNDKCFRL